MLCDFFPLYDSQSDQCTQAVHPRDSRSDDDNISVNKTIPYGFEVHKRATIIEYILAIWVFTLLCEETRQVITIIFI